MNYKDIVFVNPVKQLNDSSVIFVSDIFIEDYTGGAELTSEAIISESPYKIQKIKSKDVNLSLLSQGSDKLWIFGNFSQLNPQLIPSIVANLKYTVLEYDYKYCKLRSPEKHQALHGLPCDCHNQLTGKLVSSFYYGSKLLWWMSEAQKNIYLAYFPFLAERDNFVLSSVFSKHTLNKIQTLRNESKYLDRKGWIILGSQSWVKGFESAKRWCEENGKEYEVVWNLPYEQLLTKLSSAEGFVYLPMGMDTCPRMVIEAKLLGCELHINDNVQHAAEEWFVTDDIQSIQDYLSSSSELFWKAIRVIMEKKSTISGYTTVYNCESQGYPYLRSIASLLQFCDEVCVVDGGSTDGTWETITSLSASDPRVKIKRIERDWNHPRFAIFDGMQKAAARSMCAGEFCWQMDSDEVVHEDDVKKIIDLTSKMPASVEIVSLPVIEYWGGPDKVRLDIQPWKWRLSRNLPHITHGIPVNLRGYDETGLFALPGTDGCDMIHNETGVSIPHLTFHTAETENIRRHAVMGYPEALEAYGEWFNSAINNLPGVHHYSWYDLPRKMKQYKSFWTKFWNSLYNGSQQDTSESNMMFDVPWSEVTDEMILFKAEELKEKCGGWIWHSKWNGERTPHLTINIKEPSL